MTAAIIKFKFDQILINITDVLLLLDWLQPGGDSTDYGGRL